MDQSTSHSPEYNYNSFYSEYQNDEAYYFGLISFRSGNYIGNSDVYRDGVSTISNYGPDCLKRASKPPLGKPVSYLFENHFYFGVCRSLPAIGIGVGP
ncbi:hypothetical protein [Zunongwangia pacifica]|uniref:Uncharacterized protein n=1 Tax=Zunongwangia pacifica TaxID=2911062 RepID=A0A9X2CPI8_9FLAO|nr:hypothetical protein [Zunongwangia pacifica]MCL6218193.1 hypothetical protein [Zunongwangia pacifica]